MVVCVHMCLRVLSVIDTHSRQERANTNQPHPVQLYAPGQSLKTVNTHTHTHTHTHAHDSLGLDVHKRLGGHLSRLGKG